MKKVAILGSTGSIGTQALDVVSAHDFEVTALAANSNISLLEEQTRRFQPNTVCVFKKELYKELKMRLADLSVKIVTGMEGLCEAAALPDTDITLNAVVGMIGLRPTLAAIEAGKDIALANKET
ncbi:MAG: 1-deoxy-D-xylulose-5-phosphate reductoisomerase, partial [Oscillospiraceae bacterium]|nr:1-deoxy-D-xylulose-5-phosphate reductoisomerase [Oscillospiraceae bacterium]